MGERCGNIRIIWLACPFRNRFPKSEHLQLIADDENLGNNNDHDGREELPILEEEIILDEDKQPQEHNDASPMLHDDVPYDERREHSKDSA